jgi:drug/metabolite transporter (DMT)-like permease
MRRHPELVLVFVTLLWGSTFIVTKDIVRDAPPLGYLVARYLLAALLMLPLYGRAALRDRRLLRDGAVIALLNSFGLIFQVVGQVYTTASKSAFITSLNTPLVPLVALLVYGARPSRPQQVAVALATLGLMLLTWPGAGAGWNAGDLMTVACATIYAFTIIEIARRSRHHDALALTTVQIVIGALFFVAALAFTKALLHVLPPENLPAMVRLEARPLHVTARLAAEVVYMAVVCTAATFALQTWAMARMSATHAAVVFALEPVFATAMAIAVEGAAEWPGARAAAGACLVMLGVLASEIRLVPRSSDRIEP